MLESEVKVQASRKKTARVPIGIHVVPNSVPKRVLLRQALNYHRWQHYRCRLSEK